MTPPADRRFLIYRGIHLLACCEDITTVIAFLWGRDLRAGYLVLDYERPVPVDEPDLTAWAARCFPNDVEGEA